LNLMAQRRSVRRFADTAVDLSVLERLITAASWAPSNHNRQGWKFLVWQDKQKIEAMARAVREEVKDVCEQAHRLAKDHGHELVYYSGIFETAPVVILAMHKKSPAIGRAILEKSDVMNISSEALSAAMAVQNMLLLAESLGLGACIMTAPLLATKVWSQQELPAGFEPTCLIAVGYSAEKPAAPRRKELQHILEYK
jgi:nitroreductase